MTRRLLAVLLVGLAALTALAILMTLTTRGEEPLVDAAIQLGRSEGSSEKGIQPRFGAEDAGDAGTATNPLVTTTDRGQAPRSLSGTAIVRIEVHETATRASSVFARLLKEGEAQPSFSAEVDDVKEWSDVPPGRWQLVLTGTGWAADKNQFELVAGQRQVVRVTARNRVSGLMVAARSGRPVLRATLAPHFFSADAVDLEGEPFTEIATIDVDAPNGHFALAGLNMPISGPEVRFVVVHASAHGFLEADSDPLPMQPEPFWSGVVIAFPEPILTGRVRGTDPDLGDVPVPGAWIQLVGVDASLDQFTFIGGVAFSEDNAPEPLAQVQANLEGGFVFGPLPQAPTVLRVRALVTAYHWMEALSEPIEIDQAAAPHDVELRVRRGGRMYATLHVPLAPRTGVGERQPIARAESMTLTWLDPPPGAPVPARAVMPRQVLPSDDPEAALFEFDQGGLLAGRWRLVAFLKPTNADSGTSLGMQTIMAEFEIVDGERTDVVLQYPLDKGGVRLTGTVRLPEDFLPQMFEVGLAGRPEDGRLPVPVAQAPVSGAGAFELPDAPAGDWTLVAFASTANRRDVAVAGTFVHVGNSSPPPIHFDLTLPELVIQAGEKTRGRRLVLSGRCGDAVLDAVIAAGRVSVRPDAEGGARILGLLPGRWALTAEGEPPAQVDVELIPGAAVVRVELP